jgi:hypothetical protein
MSYQDFNTPVRYEAPPPKPRGPILKWLLIVIALVAVIACGVFGISKYLSNSMRRQLSALLPPAKVVVGNQLAWRVLAKGQVGLPGQIGMLGGLFVADFDADGDDEVLRGSPIGRSKLYEIDGSFKEVGLTGAQFMMGGIAWDYDRDGRAEIVAETMYGEMTRGMAQGRKPEDIAISQELPVYSLEGQQVAVLPAVGSMPGQAFTGDIDDDGYPELLASKPDPNEQFGSSDEIAFGKDGQQVWSGRLPGTYCCFGDIDGDGQDEIVCTGRLVRELEVYELHRNTRQLKKLKTFADWPDREIPKLCLDLNGDKKDEVVASGKGYFDPAHDAYQPFNLTAPLADQIETALSRCVGGDFDADGKPEVAVHGQTAGFIALFGPGGTCKYYEEFGDITWHIANARAGGKDHLVVQLTDRLLIYP